MNGSAMSEPEDVVMSKVAEDRIQDLERRVSELESQAIQSRRLGPNPTFDHSMEQRTKETLEKIREILDRSKFDKHEQ